MSEALNDLGAMIAERNVDAVRDYAVVRGELTIRVSVAHLVPFVEFLAKNSACNFSTLIDITAIDYPAREKTTVFKDILCAKTSRQRVMWSCATMNWPKEWSMSR